MQIVPTARRIISASCRAVVLLLGIGLLATFAGAQSLDLATPSPVHTNEVTGTIPARDLGDPRLTDHFYAFTGTPGDVLLTVESNNLNGDIDVFTASGLRPLLKFSVYAGSSSPITKSIYLRRTEDLILRVEARTPNDDDGTYRLRFGGSFQPITGGPLVAEIESPSIQPSSPPASRSVKKGRRVSSVGARIAEPPPAEVAAAPTPEPTPVESPEPGEAKAATAKAGSSNSRTRRPPPRRGRAPQPKKGEQPPATSDAEVTPAAESSEAEPKVVPARKRPNRRTRTARDNAKQPEEAESEASGPRLIIETTDGTLVNRSMTTVRRVTVEKGQVVVVGKDGKIQRIQLADVVKMSIAP